MSGPELKPCPFCGGAARLVTHRTGEDSMGAYIYCIACDAHSPHFEDAHAPRGDAITAWNTRAALPEVQAIVDAAVKAEREACAWTATNFLVGDPREGIPLRFPSGVEVAAAIRKRGEG